MAKIAPARVARHLPQLTEAFAHRRDREALVAPFRPTEVGTDTYFRGASFE